MFVILDFNQREQVVTLPDDATTDLLRELVAAEFALPLSEVFLDFAGITLPSGSLLQIHGVSEGSVITVRQRRLSLADVPPNINAAGLIQLGVDHPHILQQLLHRDNELGTLVEQRNEPKLRLLMMQRGMRGHKAIFDRDRELERLQADPDNPDNQRKIEELIRQEQVENAHAFAMENNPESFAQVSMLYVKMRINNHDVKAFVDSGAQMTIMSRSCAERCGILRLMDTRYSGIASGVGTGKILGKILMVQALLGNSFFPISVTVLESDKIDCLFGLDTLKRYRCSIDLHKNVLRLLDGSNGPEDIPFLGEGDMPKNEFHDDLGGGAAMDTEPAAGGGPAASGGGATQTHQALSSAVETLVQMTGASPEDAAAALAQAEGNADLAASLLMAAK